MFIHWILYPKQRGQTCFKALKLKKFSLKKPPAVGFKFFMKEIAVHYKLQTKHNFTYIKKINNKKHKANFETFIFIKII